MNANKRTILIVDDDKIILEMFAESLESRGFECLRASGAEEGFSILERVLVDLILLDVLMPVMDGITMLGEIRKRPEWKEIPVIVLSGLNDAGSVARALHSGASDYVEKSRWNPDDLAIRIQEKFVS